MLGLVAKLLIVQTNVYFSKICSAHWRPAGLWHLLWRIQCWWPFSGPNKLMYYETKAYWCKYNKSNMGKDATYRIRLGLDVSLKVAHIWMASIIAWLLSLRHSRMKCSTAIDNFWPRCCKRGDHPENNHSTWYVRSVPHQLLLYYITFCKYN